METQPGDPWLGVLGRFPNGALHGDSDWRVAVTRAALSQALAA
jgi:hypothetical protein